MKGDNLSVRSAREQLQAIYGAKDFMRSNQRETPDMYIYYQKQIDDLDREEAELNSWLEANGGNDYGGDYEDEPYDDAAAQEEISHFNDDLYGGTEDNYKPVIDNSEADTYNQNESTDNSGADDETTREIYADWYGDEDYSPASDTNEAPLSGSIYTDPDSGESMWIAPDGSVTSIDDFTAVEDGETEKTDSKTAWDIIKDWVTADDGEINNGSFHTDPDTGKTYYVSPDGMLTPLTAFGVDESDVQDTQSEVEPASISADSFTDPDSGKEYYVTPDGNIISKSELQATETMPGSDTAPISADSFTDPDSGETYYVTLEGNIISKSELQAAEKPVNSETAPLTGQIYTDPDSGESYHIATDGTPTTMSEMDNPAAEKTQAAQAQTDYSGIKAAPDYTDKSAAVTDGRNGQLYDYINDIGDTRDRIYNELGAENNWYGVYEYMSPDEVGTYNYLCAMQGTENADKFLRSLDNTLNQRMEEGGPGSYLRKSLNQIVYGNYTDDVTLLGTAGQIITGLLGVDLPADIRDIVYDLSNFKATLEHTVQTLLDIVGILPVIGILKNADEAAALVKNAVKNSDEAAAFVKGLVKNSDEAGDLLDSSRKISKDLIEGAGDVVKNLKPQDLMDELAQSGAKYTPDDVITVTKTPDGKLMWLEKGNSSSGLQHIIDGHTADFANRGVNDIPDYLNRTLQEAPVKTGIGARGPYADYLIDGKMYRVAYGTNGYVVSFFPLFE